MTRNWDKLTRKLGNKLCLNSIHFGSNISFEKHYILKGIGRICRIILITINHDMETSAQSISEECNMEILGSTSIIRKHNAITTQKFDFVSSLTRCIASIVRIISHGERIVERISDLSNQFITLRSSDSDALHFNISANRGS